MNRIKVGNSYHEQFLDRSYLSYICQCSLLLFNVVGTEEYYCVLLPPRNLVILASCAVMMLKLLWSWSTFSMAEANSLRLTVLELLLLTADCCCEGWVGVVVCSCYVLPCVLRWEGLVFLWTGGDSSVLRWNISVGDLIIGLAGMLTRTGLLGAEEELAEILQKDTMWSNLLSIESKWLFIWANSVFTVAN